MRKRMMRKGFTLIELLIVLAIIGVLMGIGVPVYTNQLAKAKARAVAANITSAAQALANAVTLGTISSSNAINGSTLRSNYLKGISSSDYEAFVDVDNDAGTADIYVAYKGSGVSQSLINDDLADVCDATSSLIMTSTAGATESVTFACKLGDIPVTSW